MWGIFAFNPINLHRSYWIMSKQCKWITNICFKGGEEYGKYKLAGKGAGFSV